MNIVNVFAKCVSCSHVQSIIGRQYVFTCDKIEDSRKAKVGSDGICVFYEFRETMEEK